MKTNFKVIGVITIFSVAMAALEGAVVVYLRALYYPEEFTVAFKMIDEHVLLIELAREMATIVMLLTIGYLAGKNWGERFAFFLLSFAVWDIFYYAWLKVFIDWPSSFLDWDILFLVPITWIGPVAAPIICSLTMIILATLLLHLQIEKINSKLTWLFLIGGCSLILFTFIRDYGSLILSNGFLTDYSNLMTNSDFLALASTLKPKPYAWNIFIAGEFLIVLAMINLKLSKSMSVQTESVNISV
jgi:hypothetical protein